MSFKNRSSKVLIIKWLLLLSLLEFIFLLLLVFSINSAFSLSNFVEEGKITFESYRYLEFDILRNETTRGFVTLPETFFDTFEVDYNFFSTSSRDNLFLISKFETDNEVFICKGSCWCDEIGGIEEIRRSTTGSKLVKYGVTTLVSSFSSLLAFQKAKEYFSSTACVEELSETCPSSFDSIQSEVEECEHIVLSTFGKDEENIFTEDYSEDDSGSLIGLKLSLIDDIGIDINFEEKVDEVSAYYAATCSGYCKKNRKVSSEKGLELQSQFNCEDLRLEKEFTLTKEELEIIANTRWSGFTGHVQIKFRQIFVSELLNDYCREKSKVKYERIVSTGSEESLSFFSEEVEISLCVGVGDLDHFKNVECKRKYSKRRRRYFCQGNCRKKKQRKPNPLTLKMAEDFGCEKLKLENHITVTTLEIANLEKCFDKEKNEYSIGKISGALRDKARHKFTKQFLTPYCRDNSRAKYHMYWEKGSKWKTISLCSSTGSKSRDVACFQVYPVTNDRLLPKTVH